MILQICRKVWVISMLKPIAIIVAAISLAACGGGAPINPAEGAVGDWDCKVKTIIDGRSHAQVFKMHLTADRKATLISERTYREPGVSIKYEQTSEGVWKTGGMRFGFDDLKHSIKVLKVGGRVMRQMSEGQHATFARTQMRQSLKTTPKVRFEIEAIEKARFVLIEGEVDAEDAVKTTCRRAKELTEEQIAAAEAKAAEKDEEPEDTKSALFN